MPNLLGMTMYPSALLSLTLWCLGVLSGPPHPAKNPLHLTQAPTLQLVSFNLQKKTCHVENSRRTCKKKCLAEETVLRAPVSLKKRGEESRAGRGG